MSPKEYSQLPSSDDTSVDGIFEDAEVRLLPEDTADQRSLHARKTKRWPRHSAVLLAVAILVQGCLVALAALGAYSMTRSLDRVCLRKHSYYSPMMDSLTPQYHDVRFNGSLDHESKYRGPPSPSVDEAWTELNAEIYFGVLEQELVASGSDTAAVPVAIMPEALGSGFIAGVEVNHQLHCLNLVRMATYGDQYEDKVEFSDKADTLRLHIDHCIEILRQKLMCDADAGIFTYHWVEGYDALYPNFNTMHKCRAWEDVYGWARGREVQRPEGYVFKPLPGDRKLAAPP